MKTAIKYLKILLNLFIAVGILLFIIYVLPKVIVFFMPFLIGWIIAMIANPLVRFLEKRVKIVRKHGTMLVIILAIALVVFGGYFAITRISHEVIEFVRNIPQIYEGIEGDIADIQRNLAVVYEKLPQNIQQSILAISENLDKYVQGIIEMIGAPTVEAAGNFAKNIPSTLIAIIMTVLSAYFFIADREHILKLVLDSTPEIIYKNVKLVTDNFKRVVGGYFLAQFKIMGVVAVILFIGFLILRIHYSVLLAILISILDMLPFFGTGTALIPWAVFKMLSGDYTFAIGLLIIYGVSQLVRQLIQPKIVGDTIGLNPLLTLVFMYIGYKIKGVFGMIIAVPIGMIVINLYEAGSFDGVIRNIKEIINDINEFRKW